MNHPVSKALALFSAQFVKAWEEQAHTLPTSIDVVGLSSPCVQTDDGEKVMWLPVIREPMGNLSAVEKGMELVLHEDIVAFYGSQFSGYMAAKWQETELMLLQMFCEEDANVLQENILGHLVTQRRLKVTPTVFIGAVDDESKVISICNLTGQVLLETLGRKGHREVLANDMIAFLQQLEPVVEEA